MVKHTYSVSVEGRDFILLENLRKRFGMTRSELVMSLLNKEVQKAILEVEKYKYVNEPL